MKGIFSGFLTLVLALAIILPAAAPALADSSGDAKPQFSSLAFLTIKAPNTADIGQPATVTVFSKRGRETIAGAWVYALKTADLVIKADAVNHTSLIGEYEALAEAKGILFGTTAGDGTVKGNFPETGRFILVATKDGYLPGFSRINIRGIQPVKSLEINALFDVSAGQPGALKVWEKDTNQPVAQAAVYVHKISGAGDIKLMPPTANNGKAQNGKGNITAEVKAMPPAANNEKAQGEANRAREKGALAGYTDDNGQVVFTFSSSGRYVLAAFKDGYLPDFAKINIRPAPAPVPAPLPVPQSDNATVTE